MNGDSWVVDASVLAQLYVRDEDEDCTHIADDIVQRSARSKKIDYVVWVADFETSASR